MATHTLTTKQATWLKRKPVQSTSLSNSEKCLFDKSDTLIAKAMKEVTGKQGKHLKITLDFDALQDLANPSADRVLSTRLNTWYLWPDHLNLFTQDSDNHPNDSGSTREILIPSGLVAYNKDFTLPGYKGTYNMADPIVSGGRMRWYEALHYEPSCGRYRSPADSGVVRGVVKLAGFIKNDVRPTLATYFDAPLSSVAISVNSWYRDPVTNQNVGGARYSRHLNGDAIDFRVFIDGSFIDPDKVSTALDPLMSPGGLASASVFTHIDTRDGTRARWSYGY